MVMRDLDSQLRLFIITLKIGIGLIPSFFILDYVCYPEYAFELLTIRLSISAYFLLILYVIRRVSVRCHSLMISSVFFLSAFSLSLMCFITGDGFASPYCIGVLQITMVSVLMFTMKPRYHIVMTSCIIAQHFALLSFIPFDLKSLMLNVFGIAFFAVVSVIIHFFIHSAINELRTLRGILPICSNCKKIRDDKGYWHQVESYISANSEAEFSHSLCPGCVKILYPDFVN